MADKTEELLLDRLVSGDRPSTYVLGFYGAKALQTKGVAVFMVDVLGRVVLMPPESVQINVLPRVAEQELDGFTETEAVRILSIQGDTDEGIVEYLRKRDERGAKNAS